MSKTRKIKINKIENKMLDIGVDIYRARALSRILFSLLEEPRFGIIEKFDDVSLACILFNHIKKIYADFNELESILKI